MNLTKKQIDIIRSCTPKKLKGQSRRVYTVLGYCTPSGANWSYVAGFIEWGGRQVLIVTQFGQVI